MFNNIEQVPGPFHENTKLQKSIKTEFSRLVFIQLDQSLLVEYGGAIPFPTFILAKNDLMG